MYRIETVIRGFRSRKLPGRGGAGAVPGGPQILL
jgi:hypothetical protein